MADPIQQIDEHLRRLRRAQLRPDYLQRLIDGIEEVAGVSTLRVLRSIERAGERGRFLSIRQIAFDLGIEHSTASRAVNDCIRRGLVARSTSEHDQRKALLALTPLGHRAADRATHNRQEMVAEGLNEWSDETVRTFSQLLGEFVGHLSNISAERNPR